MIAPTASPGFRLFTADEVDAMVRAGIVGEDEPLELLEGVLETMAPQSDEHAWVLEELVDRLRLAYADQRVREQKPLNAGERDRPEPDIAVVRGRRVKGQRQHPTAADTILLVEVSVTTLERDHRKAGIYARAGAPVLWILDVEGRRLEVHTEPGAEGYNVVTLLGEHEHVSVPETEQRWKIADLLG